MKANACIGVGLRASGPCGARSVVCPTRRARELAMPSLKPVEPRVEGRRGADVQLALERCGQGRNTYRTAVQLVLGEISQRKALCVRGLCGRATVAGRGTCGLCPACEPVMRRSVAQRWVCRSKFGGQGGLNPDRSRVAIRARGMHEKACGDQDSGAVALAAEQP